MGNPEGTVAHGGTHTQAEEREEAGEKNKSTIP